MDEYSWIDEQGNTHLKSIDQDVCEVILSANCLHFRVVYLYLLPTKKHGWVTTGGTQMDYDDNVSVSAYRS